MVHNTRRNSSRSAEKLKQANQAQNDKEHNAKSVPAFEREAKSHQYTGEGVEELFAFAKSPEKLPTVDKVQRITFDPTKSFSSPVSKRTPGSLLGSPFNLPFNKWDSPFHSLLSPSPAPAPPLFQPSPCKLPASPAHHFNYIGLSSPQGTPGCLGADIADILRHPFDTPGENKLTLTELFPLVSPNAHGRSRDQADVRCSDFDWEDELLRHHPVSHPMSKGTGGLKGSETDDVAGPFIGSFLVSPSTKDAFASVSRRTDRFSDLGSGPKRQLEFNHLQEASNGANLASSPVPFLLPSSTSRLSRVSKPSANGGSLLLSPAASEMLEARDQLDDLPEGHEQHQVCADTETGVKHMSAPEELLEYGSRSEHEYISHMQHQQMHYYDQPRPVMVPPLHTGSETHQGTDLQGHSMQGNELSRSEEGGRFQERLEAQAPLHSGLATINTSSWLGSNALNGITLQQHIPTTAREKALELLKKLTSSQQMSECLKVEDDSPVHARGVVCTPFGPGGQGPMKSLPQINTNWRPVEQSVSSPHHPQQQQQQQEEEQQQQQRVVYRQPAAEQESSTPRRMERKMSVASAGDSLMASVIPPPTPDEAAHPDSFPPAKSCHCKRSQCLKLYCDCFAAGLFCTNCNCSNCQNTKEYSQVVLEKRNQIKQRNPEAFGQKIKQDESTNRVRHNKGCNCRKSHCLKKYCECFQNQVECGELCKCIDCHNCDASYALQSRQRLGNRKVAASVETNQQWSETPITPKFSSRFSEESNVSTPPHKGYQDLRTIVMQSSSGPKIPVPATPITTVQPPAHAGTPPTALRSCSPSGTPTHYSQAPLVVHQPLISYQVPGSHSNNLSVSVIQLKQQASVPSPHQQHRSQMVTANQVVTNAPHSAPHSTSRPPMQSLRTGGGSQSLPTSNMYSLQGMGPSSSQEMADMDAERHSGSMAHTDPGSSTKMGRDRKGDPPLSPTSRSIHHAQDSMTSQPALSHHTSSGLPSYPPSTSLPMTSISHQHQGRTSTPTPSHDPHHPHNPHHPHDQHMPVVKAEGSGSEGGQVGVVILMQDKETGEKFQYYLPTNSSQVTQVVQQDGSILLVSPPSPTHTPSAPPQPPSPHQHPTVVDANGSVQILQLPDGQLLQIEGLQAGQQLTVQETTRADHRDSVPQITVVQQGAGLSSGRKPQVPPRRVPTGQGSHSSQQEGGYPPHLMQHLPNSRAMASMEVDGPPHRSEGSGSQDENEVPLGDLPLPHTHTDSPHSPHRTLTHSMDPRSHHLSTVHHTPPTSNTSQHPLQETQGDTPPRPRTTPTKRKTMDPSIGGYNEISGKIQHTPVLSAARHLLMTRPPIEHKYSPNGHDHSSRATHNSTHAHTMYHTQQQMASVGRESTEHLQAHMQQGGGSRGGAREGLTHPVINLPALGHHGSVIVTPTKLTLGGPSGLSKFMAGVSNAGSPSGTPHRPVGQLFRISPGSTTIKPSPGSEKRHKAS